VPIKVELRPECSADFNALPTNELKLYALKRLVELETQPRLGRKLRDHPDVGDLGDCRKIYLPPEDKPTHRIVYRLLPNEDQPTTADVITIGAKFAGDMEVYREAVRRLEREQRAGA
jgi:hypothetical protein